MIRLIEKTIRFLDLPPELRNRIYSFAFHNRTASEIKIIGASCHAPSSSLIYTSSQVWNECFELFDDAQHAFWRGHKFTIELYLAHEAFADNAHGLLRACTALRNRPIQHLVFYIGAVVLDVTSSLDEALCVEVTYKRSTSQSSGVDWKRRMEHFSKKERIQMQSREWDGCLDVLNVCKCICGATGSRFRFW